MRIILPLLTLILVSSTLGAQTFDDALRFSENNALGTARSLGTSNSMSAIGADWTAIQFNPAGLAAFRKNEVTITVGGVLSGTSDATLGAFTGPQSEVNVGSVMSSNDGSDFRTALPQLGLVFTREPIGSRWTQLNFGIGISQTNRFEENIRFNGSTPGSISDQFFETANFDGDLVFNPATLDELNAFSDGPAFDAGVLIPVDATSAPNGYFTDYNDFGRSSDTDPGVPLFKEGTISREGHNSSFDLSLGANYQEKWLFGATISIVNTSYEETNIYEEDDQDGTIEVFDNLQYVVINSHTGTGINGKFGVIYRASQALRVGVSYHTPSFISVSDDLFTNVTYRFEDNGAAVQGSGESPLFDPLDYSFVTPSTYRASAAYIIGRRGFLSADIGYRNYSGGSFSIDDDQLAESFLNEDINDLTQGAFDARFGGELNLSPFKLRAGFEFVGAPIEGEDAAYGISGGAGFRKNRFSVDLGYRLSIRPDRIFRPYTVQSSDFPQPEVDYTPTLSTMALTVGWKLVPRLYDEEEQSTTPNRKRRKRRRRR